MAVNVKVARPKKAGVNENQKEALLTYLEDHLPVARNQFISGVDGAKELQKHWEAVQGLLNSMGGASKSPQEWKKCWTDLRNGTRKRYMQEKAKRGRSGINELIRSLSAFDQRVIGIVTIEAIDGDQSREQGVPDEFVNSAASSQDILEEAEQSQSQIPESSCAVEANSDISGDSFVANVANEPIVTVPEREFNGSQMAFSTDIGGQNRASTSQQIPSASRTSSTSGASGGSNRSGQRSQRHVRSSSSTSQPPKSRDEEETEMFRSLMEIKKRKLEILEESHETNKKEQDLRMELMRAKIKALSHQNPQN